jgi:hypothetical protein
MSFARLIFHIGTTHKAGNIHGQIDISVEIKIILITVRTQL